MFKERLKIVGKKIGMWVITVVVFCLFLLALGYMNNKVPATTTVAEWIFYIIIGIVVLMGIFGMVLYVAQFINWLFIEPLKTAKAKMKAEVASQPEVVKTRKARGQDV